MSSNLVMSLTNGIDVLRVLSETSRGLSNAEIAARAGTTRATARRLLLTLTELGFVRSDGTVFALRPRVLSLGDRYLDQFGVFAEARGYLENLATTVGETCSLAVLDGECIVYVDRARAPQPLTVNIAVGTRIPAARSSSGHAILSRLNDEDLAFWFESVGDQVGGPGREQALASIRRARTDGYVLADQELDPSLWSIAAPVLGDDGRAIAAVVVSAAAATTTADRLRGEVLGDLIHATAAIGEALRVKPQEVV